MKQSKLCGSTSDIAETIIDYKEGKTDIKGVPEDTLRNRIQSAWLNYATHSLAPFGILFLITVALPKLFSFEVKVEYLFWGFTIIITILSLFHINKKFDYKVKKYFALKTGAKKRNRLKATDFKSKEFVLYDIKNIVVDYEAKGDVAKKLNKIWIKQEHPSSIISHQGKLEDVLYLDNEPVWNAHFIFDSIPKDGHLYVEWI